MNAKGEDDSELRKTFELPRPVVWSKDRCGSQRPQDVSSKDLPIISSLPPKAERELFEDVNEGILERRIGCIM